jgi:hypothetical protein
VLRLYHLRRCADGAAHGRAALVALRDAVNELPAPPLADDPFCRDGVIDVAGVRAASAHAAAFAVARRAWAGAALVSLRPAGMTRHRDEAGAPFTRARSELTRRPPTEVAWSAAVWREVCAGLGRDAAPDAEWFQAALALERNQAARRLDARFGPPAAAAGPGTTASASATGAAAGGPGGPRGAARAAAARDRKLEARDKWIYRQCCKGTAHDAIVAQLKRLAPRRGWRVVSSKQRVRQVGAEYARRHGLPPPPPRQNL